MKSTFLCNYVYFYIQLNQKRHVKKRSLIKIAFLLNYVFIIRVSSTTRKNPAGIALCRPCGVKKTRGTGFSNRP